MTSSPPRSMPCGSPNSRLPSITTGSTWASPVKDWGVWKRPLRPTRRRAQIREEAIYAHVNLGVVYLELEEPEPGARVL